MCKHCLSKKCKIATVKEHTLYELFTLLPVRVVPFGRRRVLVFVLQLYIPLLFALSKIDPRDANADGSSMHEAHMIRLYKKKSKK